MVSPPIFSGFHAPKHDFFGGGLARLLVMCVSDVTAMPQTSPKPVWGCLSLLRVRASACLCVCVFVRLPSTVG